MKIELEVNNGFYLDTLEDMAATIKKRACRRGVHDGDRGHQGVPQEGRWDAV